MNFLLKQSTAFEMPVFMADSSDHVTGKTGLTLTITASKAGAAFASISPTVTETSGGWYTLTLTTTHTNTLGAFSLHITSTGADPTDLSAQVIAFDLGVAIQSVDVAKWLGTTAATPTNAGVPEVDITHVSGISTFATATGLLVVSMGDHGVAMPARPAELYYPDRFKLSESTAARRRVYFQARSKDRNGTRSPGDPIDSWAAVVMTGRLSKNGAAGAAAGGTFAKVDTTNSPGLWYYEFTAGELDTLGVVTLYVLSSGFLAANESQMVPLTLAVSVATTEVYDTADVNVTKWLGTAAATPTVAGVPEVDVTHWIGTAAATPTVAGVPEVDVTHWRGTAAAAPTVAGIPKVEIGALGPDAITALSIEDGAFTEFKFDSTFYAQAAAAAADATRDAILSYSYASGRTIVGFFRRAGASIEKARGLKGTLVEFLTQAGVVIWSVAQDVANGTRGVVDLGDTEDPP